MRYGLLADVHGNLEALVACLAVLEMEGAERLVFLGDAVGYGADPEAVCSLLRERAAVSVLGNHDAAVAERMDMGYYYDAARDSLLWCRAQLGEANRAWLASLPYTAREGPLAFCHAAPADPPAFVYLHGVAQVEAMLTSWQPDAAVTFIGHSHLPLAFGIDGARAALAAGPAVDCWATAHAIVTAGSVGQPRDRDPRACCGVFDSDSGRFVYHRTGYDVQRARDKILAAGLAPLFGDRLLVGM